MGAESLPHPDPLAVLLEPLLSRPDNDGARLHTVQFYEEDAALIRSLTGFVGSALRAGNPAIVCMTREHCEGLKEQLAASGIALDEAIAEGRLMMLDAAETLRQIAPDGNLDDERHQRLVDELLTRTESAAGANPRIAVCGEMVALLWQEGRPEAAIRLEQMWNEVAKRHPLSLLCCYPLHVFNPAKDDAAFRSICEEHSQILVGEGYTVLGSEPERLLEICRLQQKARQFDEVAAERDRLAAELAEESQELGRLRELWLGAGQEEVRDALRETLLAAMQVQKADFGLVLLCNPEDGELGHGASVGFDEKALGPIPILSEGNGASGICMASGKRVVVEDTELDPIFAGLREGARRSGFRAVHSTPLTARSKELLGVMSVYFRQPFRPSVREMRWTEMYAQIASDVIENAGVLRELDTEQAMRRITERALSESEEFSRRIVENSEDCIKVLDVEGRLVYMSPAGQQALAIEDLSSVLGAYWPDFWKGVDRDLALEAIEAARQREVGRFQGALTVAGEVTWWEMKIVAMEDGQKLASGAPVERLIVVSRRIAEVALETQKLK